MKAYIGIGSNLGNRRMYIDKSIQLLGPQVKRISSVYETEPVDIKDGTKFLNTVVEIETDMEPMALLDFLEGIERTLGREEKGTNKSRTIDLDILLYGDQVINTPRLKIPHPRLQEREFMLQPLSELWE